MAPHSSNRSIGESVSDTFTVTATDTFGGVSTETLTITITGTNDIPVITAVGHHHRRHRR